MQTGWQSFFSGESVEELLLIFITRPDFYEGETALVNRLFEQGMQRLHLRKPKANKQEMAEWIEQIALPFRHRIVLHDHHSLAKEYQLGGIHLNSRNPEVPIWVNDDCTEYPFSISRSCHSIEELIKYKSQCDYLFLSPIFDSISKEGYGATFSPDVLSSAREKGLLKDNVIALGGISLANLSQVKAYGFAGAAVLGALWQAEDVEETLKAFLLNL